MKESLPPSENAKSIEGRVKRIEQSLTIEYSNEEKVAFDLWKDNLPTHSPDNPIRIATVGNALDYFPSVANHTGEEISIFFEKERFEDTELETLMEEFCRQDRSFEIAIIKMTDQHIRVSIGDKTRHYLRQFEGEYFAHSHPMHLYRVRNGDDVPQCIRAGILPSGGDVRGYKKDPDCIKRGTRIYSRDGHSFIEVIEKKEAIGMQEYREKFLDIFENKDSFGFKSDDDFIKYFEENLGLKIEFNYSNPHP